jgi:uncharacterized protein YukE
MGQQRENCADNSTSTLCLGIATSSENGDNNQGRRGMMRENFQAVQEQWKQQREQLNGQFQNIKDEFKNKLDQIKQEGDNFKNALKDLKLKGGDKNGERRGKALEQAHNLADNIVGAMVNRLNALKNRIDGSKLLDADKTSTKAELDVNINWLNAKAAELNAIASSTTATSTMASSTKDKIQEIRSYWGTVKITIQRVSGEILAGRLNYILSKTDELTAKLTTDLAALKAAGKDTTALDAKLADAKAKMPAVKQSVADALAKFKLITDATTAQANYDAGQTLIRDAKNALADIRSSLEQVQRGVSSLQGVTVTPPVATTTATST